MDLGRAPASDDSTNALGEGEEGVAVVVVKGRRYVVLEALVGIAQARARGAARRFPGSLYRLTLCSVDMVPHTGRLQPCLNPSHVRA